MNRSKDHSEPGIAVRVGRSLWRELLLPVLVAIGLVAIAVGLIEGPSAGDFLYAIF